MPSLDLLEEQAYIDRAYAQLGRMRRRAEELLASMKGTDPDLEWALFCRVRALRENQRALCFGRLDTAGGNIWYLGRRHVEDEDGEPVVVEWRAPIALPYYQASHTDPMGLVRRRQFVVEGRELLSIGDDYFDGPDGSTTAGPGVSGQLRGRDALLIELDRNRTGEMLDIVATIQPEQDEVIRADPTGILAVQGGPGSGKTAVGLHRAAFLLYGNDALARTNILVVGPNRMFLRYIAQVLPSLGEHAVVQTTFVDLVPEVKGARAGIDAPETERVKGDGRMATVLARALACRHGHHHDDLTVDVGATRLRLAAGELNELVDKVASSRVPHAVGRDLLRSRLVRQLVDRYKTVTGAFPPDGAAFERQVKADPAFRKGVDRRWPSVPPATLVADLLSKPPVLAAAAEGVLDEGEQHLLCRRGGRVWAPADAPLLDEAKALISGHFATYGHAIVDEAQDLSPMQLRMLSRRCPSGSVTLLGDLAQAIGVWGHRDWCELTAWLPHAGEMRVAELRLGYRSPAQVLQMANRLLPEAAPYVTPTQPVRWGPSAPTHAVVAAGDLLERVTRETVDQHKRSPSVAVITPDQLLARVLASLSVHLGAVVGQADADSLTRPVTVLGVSSARGLEFNTVIVVEPAGIVAELSDPAAGLRRLYVALTRATQHLSIVSSAPLPGPLATVNAVAHLPLQTVDDPVDVAS
jgi:DNA helicase IV